MNVLGFDTATAATVVGLLAERHPPMEARDDPAPGERPRHTSQLLREARALLRRADLELGDVERIAVGVGPGSFTGLRIGIATARALAQASGAPLVGVSTLRVLAELEEEPPPYGTVVIPVIDARRGEVFAASPGRFEPVALAPEALAARIEAGSLAVGDGAVRFRAELERAGAVVPADGSPLHRVSALEVCRLGAAAEPTDRDALLPDYRREPDAKPRQT